MFPDPLSAKGATFAYYADKYGWVLVSPGPDRNDVGPAKYYHGNIEQPSPALRLMAFDATNGTTSGGDVFWAKRWSDEH